VFQERSILEMLNLHALFAHLENTKIFLSKLFVVYVTLVSLVLEVLLLALLVLLELLLLLAGFLIVLRARTNLLQIPNVLSVSAKRDTFPIILLKLIQVIFA
jgi:hypothetical protein